MLRPENGTPTAVTSDPTTPASLPLDGLRAHGPAAFEKLMEVLPFSLAVRETMRMRALAELGQLGLPLLDVGCGDGLFWEVVTRGLERDGGRYLSGLLGIDINARELRLASVRLRQRGASLEIADISDAQSPPGFGRLLGAARTVLANCSLEHVPRLEPALHNILAHLAPDGDFLLFVPAPNWTDSFRVKRGLGRVSRRLAGLYGAAFDGFFQHHHLYPDFVWRHLLTGAGFSRVHIRGLGSRAANALFETHLAPAFAAFLVKMVAHRYPRMGWDRLFTQSALFSQFIREVADGSFIHDDVEHPDVIEYFIHCRR